MNPATTALQARYEQLLSVPADDLEEGVALSWAGAPSDRRMVAQEFLQLGLSLRDQEQAAGGALREAVHARRADALATAYLIYQGATLEQLAQLPSLGQAVAPGEIQSYVRNLGRALWRAGHLVPGDAGEQLLQMASPESLTVMAKIFGAWLAGHALGIGEFADVGIIAFGAYTLGLDALRAARSFYGYVTKCAPPASDALIESAAQDLADFVALVGVDAFAVILTGRAFRWARGKLPAPRTGAARPVTGRLGPEGGRSAGGEPGAPEANGPRSATGTDGIPEALRRPAAEAAVEKTEVEREKTEVEREKTEVEREKTEVEREKTEVERLSAADLARGGGALGATAINWTRVGLIAGGVAVAALLLWMALHPRQTIVVAPSGP